MTTTNIFLIVIVAVAAIAWNRQLKINQLKKTLKKEKKETDAKIAALEEVAYDKHCEFLKLKISVILAAEGPFDSICRAVLDLSQKKIDELFLANYLQFASYFKRKIKNFDDLEEVLIAVADLGAPRSKLFYKFLAELFYENFSIEELAKIYARGIADNEEDSSAADLICNPVGVDFDKIPFGRAKAFILDLAAKKEKDQKENIAKDEESFPSYVLDLLEGMLSRTMRQDLSAKLQKNIACLRG